jgi:SAM-dependent methyltransferase
MRRLLREERRNFGRSVLDLGCGGGGLAAVWAAPGRTYVGIDANPDMIREGRRAAPGFAGPATFLLGDVRATEPRGRFDTVVVVGNALSHLTSEELRSVLAGLALHLRPGAHFIVDYRDTVRLFFDHRWRHRFAQRKAGRRLTVVTDDVDFERGEIQLSARETGAGTPVHYTQTVWSPFILEPLMRAYGWTLRKRTPERRWNGWRDVYRYAPARRR